MTNFLDRYNLRPQEKRVVIISGLVFFILMNFWIVAPHFGDWTLLKETIRNTRRKMKVAQDEIERMKGPEGYEAKLKKLETEASPVLPEAQAIQFQVSVDKIARESGIGSPNSVSTVTDSTETANSKFFTEKSLVIGFQNVEEKNLVDFVFRLGSQSSMFRVKDLTIKPSANQQNLDPRMTIVASYLKNPAKTAAAPVSKAATNPVAKGKPAAGAVTNSAAKPAVKPASKPPTNSLHRPPAPDRKQGMQPGRPGGPGSKPGAPGVPRPNRPANPASNQ